jgi:hypothetical protein
MLLGLYRVIRIIGRNGVGETTLLANLVTSLSGIKKIILGFRLALLLVKS